jgi:hypothetical protein
LWPGPARATVLSTFPHGKERQMRVDRFVRSLVLAATLAAITLATLASTALGVVISGGGNWPR